MYTAKHTPGPWQEVCDGGSHPIDIMGEDGNAYIASCEGTRDGQDMEINEMEANARLIAAAPDMLEALRGMVDLVESIDGFDPREGERGHAEFCAARIALEMAEGGE